ncbi:hypothetical protein IAD21_06379 [Abditibacteriota bacterium]|nr:hypothetical protein IAD21_06379 [Abditibacteriota bacterium]
MEEQQTSSSPAHSARGWKTIDGNYLLETGTAPWPLISVVCLPTGEVLEHATQYSVITAEGKVTATYPWPSVDSLDDSLYLHGFYEVIGDQFCRILWEEPWRREGRVTIMDVELRDLERVSDEVIASIRAQG